MRDTTYASIKCTVDIVVGLVADTYYKFRNFKRPFMTSYTEVGDDTVAKRA